MRLIDIHIARTITLQILLCFAVLLGLFVFVTFLDQFGELGDGGYTLVDATRYTLLTVPRTAYDLFPMCALLGTMLGLSQMAQDSELIVLRSSGLSVGRIAGAVLKVGVVLGIIAVLLGEFVTPWTETVAQRGRAEALQQDIQQQGNFGLWMRDEETFVNIGEVLPDLTLLNVRLFEFDEDRKLRALSVADQAVYDSGEWRLESVDQTIIGLEQGRTASLDEARWKTVVTPDILQVFLIKPDQLSMRQLVRYITHLEDNRQDTARWRLDFWGKLMLPIATCVMVILAIPFAFGQLRSSGVGRNLVIGIMLGLAFYVANEVFGNVVLVFDLMPIVGAVLPTAAFMLFGWLLLRRVR